MTNSREKFEAWVKSLGYQEAEDLTNFNPMLIKAWLAGRESMKNEALKACADCGPDAYNAFHSIKEIQP